MSSHHHVGPAENPSRRSVLRGVVAVAGGAVLGGAVDLAGARGATAAAIGAPTLFDRKTWGARSPRNGAQTLTAGPDHIVIHHTATGNSTDYSEAHAFALSRSIQRHHMDSNKWDDTGQQLTIGRGGHVMEGRNGTLAAIGRKGHVVGAHVAGHNSHTIGIENEGTYDSATPPDELLAALVETCAWLCTVYGLDPSSAIVGHRDYNTTGCPGDKLYSLLPTLRTDVGARLAETDTGTQRRAYAEVPPQNRPGYPAVPREKAAAPYDHGPAIGGGEPNR